MQFLNLDSQIPLQTVLYIDQSSEDCTWVFGFE